MERHIRRVSLRHREAGKPHSSTTTARITHCDIYLITKLKLFKSRKVFKPIYKVMCLLYIINIVSFNLEVNMNPLSIIMHDNFKVGTYLLRIK